MTEEKIRMGTRRKNFVICDTQTEYSENLFQIFVRKYPGEYQFHIFHDFEKMRTFSLTTDIAVLLISDQYEEIQIREIKAERIFWLSESKFGGTESEKNRGISIFRYQPAGKIMEQIAFREQNPLRRERPRIRDEPAVRGILGVYSPIHRIGKTKFAMRLGYQMAEKVPVLYLNMEGCSGGNYYFPRNPGYDMGDLLYCLRQNNKEQGMKISTMTGNINGLDYILPMRNEADFRSVGAKEWISLLDTISEKCIYESIILDLGDAVRGLYEILRKCSRIYTPYIEEEAAAAKMAQYENSLREAGYGDILARTVKRKIKKSRFQEEKDGGFNEADRAAL